MIQPTFQTLPTECVIEIIQHLNWPEVNNLTQTCKKFNDVVSSNTKLLEKICYNFSQRVSTLVFVQSRKYTKFQFEDCLNENLQNFKIDFSDNLKNIRELTIGSFNRFKISKLIEVLSTLQNLKNLNFQRCYVVYPNEPEDAFTEELRLKLDSLTLFGDYKILKHFKKSTVKSLKLYQGSDSESLKKFLATQTNLESLQLESFKDFSGLIDENFNFKLKNLTIESCTASPDFVEFLISQKSLENVKLKGVISSTLINMLVNLNRINLNIDFGSFIEFESINVLSNVKSLEISCKNQTSSSPIEFSKFDGRFPNLRHFRLVKFQNFKPISSFDLLKSCSIEYTTMQRPLNIPQVKNLKFFHVTFQMIRTPFNFNKNSVENLEVKHCYFAAWIYQLFQHENTKLNSLVLFNKIGSYKKEVELRQKAVDENRHKVKKLKIVRC